MDIIIEDNHQEIIEADYPGNCIMMISYQERRVVDNNVETRKIM